MDKETWEKYLFRHFKDRAACMRKSRKNPNEANSCRERSHGSPFHLCCILVIKFVTEEDLFRALVFKLLLWRIMSVLVKETTASYSKCHIFAWIQLICKIVLRSVKMSFSSCLAKLALGGSHGQLKVNQGPISWWHQSFISARNRPWWESVQKIAVFVFILIRERASERSSYEFICVVRKSARDPFCDTNTISIGVVPFCENCVHIVTNNWPFCNVYIVIESPRTYVDNFWRKNVYKSVATSGSQPARRLVPVDEFREWLLRPSTNNINKSQLLNKQFLTNISVTDHRLGFYCGYILHYW